MPIFKITSPRFIFTATAALALFAGPAHAGFIMGSSGSGGMATGYSRAPATQDPVTPEYNPNDASVSSQEDTATPTIVPVPVPTLQAPGPAPVTAEPLQPVEHYPSYPAAPVKPTLALKPAPIPAPALSSAPVQTNPSMQLHHMGTMSVTNPETRVVNPVMHPPRNMPYPAGSNVMQKPLSVPPAKSWGDDSSANDLNNEELRNQGHGRFSQELQQAGEHVLQNPYASRVSAVPVQAPEAPSAPAQPQNFSDAVGFASDIPLALALSQIVPPQYAYSFGTDVNPGYRVSWNGGKPWNQVVEEMVAPLNLHSEIKGNMVVIRSGAQKRSDASMPQTQRVAVNTAPADVSPAPRFSAQEALNAATANAATRTMPQNNNGQVMVSAPPSENADDAFSGNDIQKLEKITNVDTMKAVPVANVPAVPVQTANVPAPSLPAPVKAQEVLQQINTVGMPGSAPPPPAMEVEQSNRELGLPADQPRRHEIRDPGEQAGTQANRDIKNMRDFGELPKAQSFDSPEEDDSAQNLDEQPQTPVVAPQVTGMVDQEQMQSQARIWEAKQGDSLKKVLSDWSDQANVALEWDASHDYALSSNVFINGTYSNAVKILFTHGFDAGKTPAHQMTNANGKTVLAIQDPV